MAANKLQWRRIAKGDKLPCQSFLRKKNGEILKLSTGAGVKVGQDAYYLPVDDVIEEIKNYPIEESEDEKNRREIKQFIRSRGMSLAQSKVDSWIAWLEKQGEPTDILANAVLDSNKDGLIADTIQSKPKFKVGDKIYLKPEYRMPDDDTPIANTVKEIRRIDDKYYRFDRSYIFIEDQDKYELVEQKSAEWSKEDEKVLDNILYILNQLKDTTPHKEDETAKECIDRLKSLKERYTWKPSDEQMTALRRMKNAIGGEGEIYEPLNSLYEDLKKLKG